MLHLNFRIKNPWAKNSDNKKCYFYKEKKFAKYWAYCIQIERGTVWDFISFGIRTTWQGEDHAGPEIEFSFMGYWAMFQIYNTRHWDYDNGKWEEYDE